MLEWRSIETAPKDGTPIEIQCSYGVVPWTRICRWTTERWAWVVGQGDKEIRISDGPGEWRNVNDRTKGYASEARHTLKWRPWVGDPATHKDPLRDVDPYDYWLSQRSPRRRGY